MCSLCWIRVSFVNRELMKNLKKFKNPDKNCLPWLTSRILSHLELLDYHDSRITLNCFFMLLCWGRLMLKNKMYTIWPSNGLQSDLSLISALKQRVPVQMIFQRKSRFRTAIIAGITIRVQWKARITIFERACYRLHLVWNWPLGNGLIPWFRNVEFYIQIFG